MLKQSTSVHISSEQQNSEQKKMKSDSILILELRRVSEKVSYWLLLQSPVERGHVDAN